MARYLNIENWNRKGQFYFFKDYDYPFFNICADVDVTALLSYCKDRSLSFFKTSLYLSLKSANEVEAFRYRIRGDRVVIHEVIHCGSTVLNADETFSFCYFDYHASFERFENTVSAALDKNASKGKSLDPQDERDDLIHYSMIPWISFTSFSHARKFQYGDSVPKIVFGKYYEQNALTKMPVSVEVHHALMDGIHVAKFFEFFQKHLNCPEKSLRG